MTTKEFRASVGSELTNRDKLYFILSHGSLEIEKTVHNGVESECYLFTAKDRDLKLWVPVKEYLDPLERLFDTVYNDYKYFESKNKLKNKVMKLKCNVCKSPKIIELLEPDFGLIGTEVYCEDCDKLMAELTEDYNSKPYWYIYNSKYDKDFGGIPVEIIK